MKKIIIALTVLTLCSTANPALAGTRSNCHKNLAQKTYETILHLVRKDNPDLLTFDNGEMIERQMIILGSLDEPEAFKLLIALLDIYIGESTGEILSQIIVEKGKKIIPYLKKASNTPSICDPRLYKCWRDDIKSLIEAIKKGESYGAGEPLPYLSTADLKKKCGQ